MSTGAVLSQFRHRRHPSKLCGQRALQTAAIHEAGDNHTKHPPQSLMHIHISSGWGARRRVPCSHNLAVAVIIPSSVGIVPSRLSRLRGALEMATNPPSVM